MNSTLLSLSKKPVLWKRSEELFWDDEHISKGMLEMHLNPNLELASRTHDTIDNSVQWLSTIIKANSKILDLGCGPGLYGSRLSKLGYDVTGVDYSKRSITYAKEHDKKTKYIYQNYLDIDFDNEFDVIILIYCDFAALTKDERKTLLSKVRKALKSSGLFIFDVFSITSFKNEDTQPTWSFYESGGYWSSNPHICLEAIHRYENNTVSLNQFIVVTDTKIKEYLIWNTMYDLESLTAELSVSGFSVKEKFDDVCGKPYSRNSDTICMIACPQ